MIALALLLASGPQYISVPQKTLSKAQLEMMFTFAAGHPRKSNNQSWVLGACSEDDLRAVYAAVSVVSSVKTWPVKDGPLQCPTLKPVSYRAEPIKGKVPAEVGIDGVLGAKAICTQDEATALRVLAPEWVKIVPVKPATGACPTVAAAKKPALLCEALKQGIVPLAKQLIAGQDTRAAFKCVGTKSATELVQLLKANGLTLTADDVVTDSGERASAAIAVFGIDMKALSPATKQKLFASLVSPEYGLNERRVDEIVARGLSLADAEEPLLMMRSTLRGAEAWIKAGAAIDKRGKNGWNAVDAAMFLDDEANIGVIADGKTAVGGWTPLMLAAGRGDDKRVDELLAAGADVNAVSPAGHDALHAALARDRVKIVEALLKKGAVVTHQALICCVEGDRGVAMLEVSKNPSTLRAGTGRYKLFKGNALHHAALRAPLSLHPLLKAGGDVNAATELGLTPLMLAADASPIPVETLLAAKADPERKDATGKTALQRAQSRLEKNGAADVLFAGSKHDDLHMFIAGGGNTQAAGQAALEQYLSVWSWRATGDWPHLVESAKVDGLKPGFWVIGLGVCAGTGNLAAEQALEKNVYARPVKIAGVKMSDCPKTPTLHASSGGVDAFMTEGKAIFVVRNKGKAVKSVAVPYCSDEAPPSLEEKRGGFVLTESCRTGRCTDAAEERDWNISRAGDGISVTEGAHRQLRCVND